MKKTRILITLLMMMMVATSVYAQDSYRQALKEYYALYSRGNKQMESLKQVYKQGCLFWFKSGNLDLNQLTDQYMEEGMVEFMTDYMLPKMKEKGVTEKSMRESISQLSSPQGQTFHAHEQQFYDAIKPQLTSIMEQNRAKIMAGEATEPVQPRADIDAEYIEKFMNCIGDQTSKSFEPIFDMYTRYLTKFGERLGTTAPDGMVEQMGHLKTWMVANLPTIALNSAYGILTMEDLDYAIASKMNADDSAYSKMQTLVTTIDPMELGVNMMTDYIEWMQNHGAVMQEGAMDLINGIKQTFGN